MEKAQQSKVKLWFNEKFVPSITKLGSQIHLASLRDAFGTLIPLTIAGSFGLIMSGIVFGGGGSGYVSLLGLIAKAAHPELSWDEVSNLIAGTLDGYANNGFNKTMLIGSSLFGQINSVTIGMTSLWFAYTFGYFLASARNSKSPVIAGFVSLISFLATTMGQVSTFQGAEGLITALLFGIISTELFCYLSNVKALYIKLPDGVPPSVSKSFAVFLPFMITVSLVAFSNIVFVAPNLLGANLSVTKSAYSSWTGEDLTNLFNMYTTQGSVNEALKDAFTDYNSQSLINQLAQIFESNLSVDSKLNALQELYNSLNSTDQSTLATMIATLSGVNPDTIANLYGDASLEFINSNGVDVLLSKYNVTSISGANFGWSAAIYQFFVSALLTFATGDGGLGLALAYAFFISFLWFFGVHGSNVVNGAFSPIWSMIGTINLTLISQLGYAAASKTGEMGVFSGAFFDTFMNLGGTGGTFALILGTLIFSRRQELKKIATYAAPSGVFQINEPILFGYPIVLNPIYVAPFILAPMANVIVAWIFSPDVLGVVGYAQITVPWTTPFFIASIVVYLDPKGLIPALAVTGLTFVIYLPFILLDNKVYFKKLRRDFPETYELEMKYYNDPRFRYQTITTNKYEKLFEKADVIVNNAESQNRFWDQKMSSGEKLEARKAKLLAIAELRKAYKLKEAEAYKQVRIEKEKLYNDKWDKENEIFNLKAKAKLEIVEAKKQNEIGHISEIKSKLKEDILKVKENFISSNEARKEKISNDKVYIQSIKDQLKEKLKEDKIVLKEQLAKEKQR